MIFRRYNSNNVIVSIVIHEPGRGERRSVRYLLLFEWQGMSCFRLFSSICSMWLKEPSSSCTVTLIGPCKETFKQSREVRQFKPAWVLTEWPGTVLYDSPHISEFQMMCSPDGSPAPARSSFCWRQSCRRISPHCSDLCIWTVKTKTNSRRCQTQWRKTQIIFNANIWMLFSFLFTVSITATSTTLRLSANTDLTAIKDTPTVWWGGLCLCQRRWRWIWGRHEWTEASGSTCDSGTSETRLYWPDSGACWKPKQ